MKFNKNLSAIKKTISILSNPKQEFKELENKSIDLIVAFYIRMLVMVSLLTGLFNLLFSILRAFYLDLFVTVDIQYIRMINYSLGISSSLILLYLFSGTFILFLVSLVINPFIGKLKYVEILKILMYSAAPFLLFGWLPFALPFIIWSTFLFIIGLKTYKTENINKESIHNRN